MSSKLLVIGASWEQVPLIRQAKLHGCDVIVTNPSSAAEGFQYADAVEVLDPRDLEKSVALAKKYQVDGVTADECDYSNYAASFVRTVLKLPNPDMNSVQLTTNKHWMRRRCQLHNVVQPRFFACRTLEEVNEAIELIDFPVIFKPVDNRGSFGVRRVDSPIEIEDAFLHALMNSHSREVLVEAYIDGTHLTVDGCFDRQGQHYNLAVASKTITPGIKPIITEVVYPAEIAADMTKAVSETNSKVVRALGLRRGLTHSEYILDDSGRCFLLETANRGGGVLTSGIILPLITGVDLNQLLVCEALGEDFLVQPWDKKKAAKLVFFIFPEGKVASISGLEKVRTMSGVEHFKLLIQEGDDLKAPESGAGRHGFGIFIGESLPEVDTCHREAVARLSIQYE